MIYEITTPKITAPLFGNWQETMIWSCLQGIMGNIYADNPDNPTAAMALLGDFTFFAGEPSMELAAYKPAWCTQNFMIMIPQNDNWENTIMQTYGDKAKVVLRYATKKEYRRRGLACACGAKLILECLKRSLYPSWDAQNKCSIALAEKLGYHYSHTYTAIEVQR